MVVNFIKKLIQKLYIQNQDFIVMTIKQLFNDLILIYKIKFLACRLAGGNVIRYHTWFCYYAFITIMKFMLKK